MEWIHLSRVSGSLCWRRLFVWRRAHPGRLAFLLKQTCLFLVRHVIVYWLLCSNSVAKKQCACAEFGSSRDRETCIAACCNRSKKPLCLHVSFLYRKNIKWAIKNDLQTCHREHGTNHIVMFLLMRTSCSVAVPLREPVQALWSGTMEEMQQGGGCDSYNGEINLVVEIRKL